MIYKFSQFLENNNNNKFLELFIQDLLDELGLELSDLEIVSLDDPHIHYEGLDVGDLKHFYRIKLNHLILNNYNNQEYLNTLNDILHKIANSNFKSNISKDANYKFDKTREILVSDDDSILNEIRISIDNQLLTSDDFIKMHSIVNDLDAEILPEVVVVKLPYDVLLNLAKEEDKLSFIKNTLYYEVSDMFEDEDEVNNQYELNVNAYLKDLIYENRNKIRDSFESMTVDGDIFTIKLVLSDIDKHEKTLSNIIRFYLKVKDCFSKEPDFEVYER